MYWIELLLFPQIAEIFDSFDQVFPHVNRGSCAENKLPAMIGVCEMAQARNVSILDVDCPPKWRYVGPVNALKSDTIWVPVASQNG